MDSPAMFKTAMGGFDKKAVMNYIFELNESNQAAQKRLTDQLEEAAQAREALEQQLAEANKKLLRVQSDLTGVQTELQGEKTRSGELAETVDTLNTELERQKELLIKRDDELRLQGVQYGQTEQRLKEMEKKQQELDRAATQVGRLLLDANADAEQVRADAQAEARQVKADARAEADDLLAKTRIEAESIAAEANRRASEITDNANRTLQDVRRQFAGLHSDISGIQRMVLDTIGDMRAKAEEVGELMESAERTFLCVQFSLEPGEDAPQESEEQPELEYVQQESDGERAEGETQEQTEPVEDSFFR